MNKLLKVFLSLSTSIIFFPNISAATERINVPVANMHEAANENSSIVSQAIYAEKVKIIKKDSNWFLIQSNDDYQGWVKSDEIIDVNNYFESGNIITTLSREPLIYRSPSTGEYKPLLKLPFGVKLTSIDNTDKTEQRWIKVRLLDGKTAWIQRGDIRVGLDKLNMAEMINLSQAFIGAPYTWGGRSSFGFDCSGFVQQMYKTMGVSLPRDSKPQSEWDGFRKVSKASLKPGDLLFFGETKVTHVGMFLANNNGRLEFIDATVSNNLGHNAPYLQISNLNAPYWKKLYLGARRLINPSKS
ncbi:C40 family peptidase [Photobacterium angustum]|uniref:C40 family peptidase n=2 Tax=Photobacterium angustum TaxID=661 RepID=UPI00069BD253|nr:SH3 domain-containing C40 family peptidase [Photobacterium angustum]PSV95096.1 glycoside hydrolase [Photobacterium angustum]PSW80163.1 glycoside hydrolase [Photobacterium angustum]